MTLETKLDILESKIDKLHLEQKTILNIDEVAKYTSLSKDYIYRLTSTKQIPHSKPTGRKLFFEKIEVDNFLMMKSSKI